ncbi:MAG: hypothetical protein FWD13_05495 [Treponema sp.]|nr:hypothetical protein [Treponema sp.]
MSAHISFKYLLFILFGGILCAAGMAFLVTFIVSGPKLGKIYDFLAKFKKPNISNEILIIETDEYVGSRDFFTVLITLTEMEASSLILTSRLSPSAIPITVTEAEIRRRFYDEYLLVGANIRNLFEGIRMGSVTPVQAPDLVEQVVELAEFGRDRLISSLIDRDDDLIRSISVFGNFLESYTRPLMDTDGKLRRVKPIDIESSVEHPVYLQLKNRYDTSRLEASDQGQILWLRGFDGKDLDIHLDKNGNILTCGNLAFRYIDIELFREYEEAEKEIRQALEMANEFKVFAYVPQDRIPLVLDNYALTLLQALLHSPNNENRQNWITARNNYFSSLEDFLNGPAEIILINSYEDQISDIDSSNEKELAVLISAKNELSSIFALARESYKKMLNCHTVLKNELSQSLCVMGTRSSAEYSALLANVMLTGSYVKPAYDRAVLFWSILISFIILLIIFLMRPAIMLIVGLLLCFLSAFIYSCISIYYSYWIDPVVVLSASLFGTLIVFCCKSLFLNYQARSFRSAYKTAVSKDVIRKIINIGKPKLSDINVVFSAIVAVRDNELFNKEENEKPHDAARAKKTFFAAVKKAVFNAGAVIAGYEGDTILVCFGSPLEPNPVLTAYKWTEEGLPLAKTYHPVERACAFVRQQLKKEKNTWHFGIDAGECSFSWTPETGFSASGSPAVRARILVSKTSEFHIRALITDIVREKIELISGNIGVLYDENDLIYEL